MRHRVAGVKLSRTAAHRRALFRNLVTALLEHEAIRTTDAKAKEIRRWADRMITLGKQGTLHARRRAAAVLRRASVVKKLFDDLAPRYAERNGGYTRVVKLGHRLVVATPLPALHGRRPRRRCVAGEADTSAIAPFGRAWRSRPAVRGKERLGDAEARSAAEPRERLLGPPGEVGAARGFAAGERRGPGASEQRRARRSRARAADGPPEST